MTALAGKRIVLGVTGGIAAYKAIEVCRRLVDAGAHVVPIMTKGAEHFIGRTTLSALASEPVHSGLYDDAEPSPHTRIGQSADLVLVAPATARIIGAYAAGLSTDLLTNTLLATRAPVLVAPAMHTEMWQHPATRANVAALRARDQFGIGQQVEINLLSSALSAMVNQSGAYLGAGVIPGLLGNSHPSIVPYGVFQAKDRPFIIAAGNDHQFSALCEILNMKVDQKFATNKSRVENRSELEKTLNSLLEMKNAAEWIELLRAKKIPAGPINSIAEAFDFAREIGLDVIVDIDGAKSVANPISLSKTEASYRLPPPSM